MNESVTYQIKTYYVRLSVKRPSSDNENKLQTSFPPYFQDIDDYSWFRNCRAHYRKWVILQFQPLLIICWVVGLNNGKGLQNVSSCRHANFPQSNFEKSTSVKYVLGFQTARQIVAKGETALSTIVYNLLGGWVLRRG